ncbi:MAG: hypothetical protein AB7U38_06580 [Hyphomicrobiales bacterium]
MLASALKMVALARIGAQAKDLAIYGFTQAALAALAGLLALAAFVFALVAGYLALLARFSPPEAAGLVALGLLGLVLAVFAVMWLVSWRRSRRPMRPLAGARPLDDTARAVRRGAAQAADALGPAKLVSIALIAGIAAGRRATR